MGTLLQLGTPPFSIAVNYIWPQIQDVEKTNSLSSGMDSSSTLGSQWRHRVVSLSVSLAISDLNNIQKTKQNKTKGIYKKNYKWKTWKIYSKKAKQKQNNRCHITWNMVHRALIPWDCLRLEGPLWEVYEEESGEGIWEEMVHLAQPEAPRWTWGPVEEWSWEWQHDIETGNTFKSCKFSIIGLYVTI